MSELIQASALFLGALAGTLVGSLLHHRRNLPYRLKSGNIDVSATSMEHCERLFVLAQKLL